MKANMTNAEAIKKLDYMRKAYQELRDTEVKSGTFSGNNGEISGEWETEENLSAVYQVSIDALEMAIYALEMMEELRKVTQKLWGNKEI